MSRLRLMNGQFAPRDCRDPNCCGSLVADTAWTPWGEKPVIRCDGLTAADDTAPLVACMVEFDATPQQGSPRHG